MRAPGFAKIAVALTWLVGGCGDPPPPASPSRPQGSAAPASASAVASAPGAATPAPPATAASAEAPAGPPLCVRRPSAHEQELEAMMTGEGRCAQLFAVGMGAIKSLPEAEGRAMTPDQRVARALGAINTKPAGMSDADFAFCGPKIQEALELGVSRYLLASKTSEAKNLIGAIRRGLAAAFEREHVDGPAHRFCGSAVPVPKGGAPRGTKHAPAARDGADWQTGNDTEGWRCIRVELTQPHYFRYGYSQGSGYRGVALGGPDPGPDGVEIWAEGDLDGDGETSLYWVVGTVEDDMARFTDLHCVRPDE